MYMYHLKRGCRFVDIVQAGESFTYYYYYRR